MYICEGSQSSVIKYVAAERYLSLHLSHVTSIIPTLIAHSVVANPIVKPHLANQGVRDVSQAAWSILFARLVTKKTFSKEIYPRNRFISLCCFGTMAFPDK